MKTPSAIIALSDAEIADFLPGSMWSEMQELLPARHQISPQQIGSDGWLKLWKETHAEILISAWQTPSLNSTLPISDLKSLRYVCHLAGTVRKLVPRELIQRGVVVTNWGDSISLTVAECTLMLILMAHRRASYWAVAMHREGAWKNSTTVTQSLQGRRVGIHGFGSISQTLVPLLHPLTSDIKTYSPHVPDDILRNLGVKRVDSLDELFAKSDVIVELAAATPENYHVVKEHHLRLIPDGGVFVNVGRGCVVDDEGLLRVAREGRIQIALDVYETEPLPPTSPLRGLDNVTLLPHLGGPTRDRRRDSGTLALRNIRAFLRGEPLEAVISLDIYDRAT